jgi:hypothetical protein
VSEWGRYGSASEHQRYLQEASSRRRRCVWCRNKRAATHLGMANGVCLASGCEWHMRQWVRDTEPRKAPMTQPKKEGK